MNVVENPDIEWCGKCSKIKVSHWASRPFANIWTLSLDSNLLHVKRRNTVIARDLRPITWQKICWTVISIQRPEILSGVSISPTCSWKMEAKGTIARSLICTTDALWPVSMVVASTRNLRLTQFWRHSSDLAIKQEWSYTAIAGASSRQKSLQTSAKNMGSLKVWADQVVHMTTPQWRDILIH